MATSHPRVQEEKAAFLFYKSMIFFSGFFLGIWGSPLETEYLNIQMGRIEVNKNAFVCVT